MPTTTRRRWTSYLRKQAKTAYRSALVQLTSFFALNSYKYCLKMAQFTRLAAPNLSNTAGQAAMIGDDDEEVCMYRMWLDL